MHSVDTQTCGRDLPQWPTSEVRVLAARRVLDEAVSRKVTVKLAGSVGYWEHCPKFRHLQLRGGRILSDIDLVGHFRDKARIEGMLRELGFHDDPRIATIPGLARSIFRASDDGSFCDVCYDTLDFCHVIDLRGRLGIDHTTIPLLELLLQKLQIVELTEKDVLDVQTLLREHDLGTGDSEVVNLPLLCRICSHDWGLCQTTTLNLTKIKGYTAEDKSLNTDDREIITSRLTRILLAIQGHPKSIRWTLRSLVGDRVRWYNQVEEVGAT